MARYVDQVVRKAEFQAAHPEVAFTYNQEHRFHRATVEAHGTTHEVVERELRPLLDRLEQIVAGDE
jgi:hypothetical protein